jgi:hypothetical protein
MVKRTKQSKLTARRAGRGSGAGSVIVSATVPKDLVAEIRTNIGDREFSRFVTSALRGELVRLHRAQAVAEIESKAGPIDPREIAKARRALRT